MQQDKRQTLAILLIAFVFLFTLYMLGRDKTTKTRYDLEVDTLKMKSNAHVKPVFRGIH